MLVTKKDDIIRGLERLGLHVEVGRTKVKEWERLHVHQVVRPRTEENIPLMRYICKISLLNGMLNTYTFKGLPDYYCYAVKLMLDQAKILNPINFYAIGQKAYNETLHLKEAADAILLDTKKSEKERKKLHHKAMLRYHWEKQKLFTSLFTQHYYGGVAPKGNTRYDL